MQIAMRLYFQKCGYMELVQHVDDGYWVVVFVGHKDENVDFSYVVHRLWIRQKYQNVYTLIIFLRLEI
jgi:hypothetical protein